MFGMYSIPLNQPIKITEWGNNIVKLRSENSLRNVLIPLLITLIIKFPAVLKRKLSRI
jgi:hypothetical protein